MGSTVDDFRIIIVGGGIAGLAAAVALRAPNRQITILERSRMAREVGALISLQPNATRIASERLGLDPFLREAAPMADRAFRLFGTDGTLQREVRLDAAQFGGFERVVYHRQDLHGALRAAATSTSGPLPGPAATIRAGAAVAGVDCAAGTVTLAGGEALAADLVVGADGIHSAVRTAVLGRPRAAVPTGISAYRLLVPAARVADLVPALPPRLLDPADPSTTMVVGRDRRVVMGPGRGGALLGIVALVPDAELREASSSDAKEGEEDAGAWVQPGDPAKLLESYADFPEWLRALFARAAADDDDGDGGDVALWQLRDVDPLPRWVRGRAVLVGDAAHAMLPTQGQGASQSFEDAEALGAFFADVEGRPAADVVRAALAKVFRARYDRASLIQTYSRQQARPATDEGDKRITLDPAQFMKYNCDYHGAVDWLARMEREEAALGDRGSLLVAVYLGIISYRISIHYADNDAYNEAANRIGDFGTFCVQLCKAFVFLSYIDVAIGITSCWGRLRRVARVLRWAAYAFALVEATLALTCMAGRETLYGKLDEDFVADDYEAATSLAESMAAINNAFNVLLWIAQLFVLGLATYITVLSLSQNEHARATKLELGACVLALIRTTWALAAAATWYIPNKQPPAHWDLVLEGVFGYIFILLEMVLLMNIGTTRMNGLWSNPKLTMENGDPETFRNQGTSTSQGYHELPNQQTGQGVEGNQLLEMHSPADYHELSSPVKPAELGSTHAVELDASQPVELPAKCR
ncbi:hypothetical protein F4780DRAFT_774196 [Xylariomycetidae sp. FL0641]|nr:hypothetical protein F4780DRAFT_774196 [Xylariomycetidae sp. FL0641]